jgi:hypothetical protein
MEGETTFSDYKDVDGTMQPFSMESGAKDMPQKQKLTFSKIELNVALDDARFAVPAGATGGAPAAAVADTAKTAPKQAAAVTDTTKKDTKGKSSKSTAKKKG